MCAMVVSVRLPGNRLNDAACQLFVNVHGYSTACSDVLRMLHELTPVATACSLCLLWYECKFGPYMQQTLSAVHRLEGVNLTDTRPRVADLNLRHTFHECF